MLSFKYSFICFFPCLGIAICKACDILLLLIAEKAGLGVKKLNVSFDTGIISIFKLRISAMNFAHSNLEQLPELVRWYNPDNFLSND